jgi:hypothetical protein
MANIPPLTLTVPKVHAPKRKSATERSTKAVDGCGRGVCKVTHMRLAKRWSH